MIDLTDLKGRPRSLKGTLIREIRNVPDTVLVLLNGNCIVVRESVEEVLDKLYANPRKTDFRSMEAFS
jgi:uncharacterized protein YlzI (FlbEa/FlbD family)